MRRAEILKRAGHRCEKCGVPKRVYRPLVRHAWTNDIGQAETWAMDGEKVYRVSLTIAHLDNNPENNSPSNLAALCRSCYLRRDIKHNRKTAYLTGSNDKATLDLFNHA